MPIDDLSRKYELYKNMRDYRTRPSQAEFEMDRDLGKDMRDYRTRPTREEEQMEGVRQYIIEKQRQRRGEGLHIPMSRAPELERRATEFLHPDDIMREGLPPAHGFGERGTLAGDMWRAFLEIAKMAGPGRGLKAFREAKRRIINPKRGREGKIDPAEYDKWSDEVSKNAPDPTPENLLGQTKPDKHHLLGKRWFRGRGR